MAEGIDHLLRVFGSMLHSGGALTEQELHLALLKRDDQFRVSYFHYDANENKVVQVHKEVFQNSNLQDLAFFCAFPSPNGDDLTVEFNDKKYYARPLSLWLAPVAFLLVPLEKRKKVEKCLRKNDTLLQATLLDSLWRNVDDIFEPTMLSTSSEETFQTIFFRAISDVTMSRSWTTQQQNYEFSPALFSDEVKSESLTIQLDDEISIQFEVSTTIKSGAEGTALEWAYGEKRLAQQKILLEGKIQQQYRRLLQQREDYKTFAKIAGFGDKISSLKTQVAEVVNDLNEVEKQLERCGEHVIKLLHATPVSFQAINRFYHVYKGKYKVFFENKEIYGIGSQVCRILHTLLCHPEITFDMYLLYANTQAIKETTSTDDASTSEEDGAQQMVNYLNKDLIRPDELKKARVAGELRFYEKRLKKGILLLEKCVKLYPELELASVLKDYQYYYEEYMDEGLIAESFGAPALQESMIVSKRTARERISVQINKLHNQLQEAEFRSFSSYLKEVIVHTEENGIHYYTFQPQAAASAKWRAIDWTLFASDE